MIDVDPQFLAFLRGEEERARDDSLSEERANAIDFYNGELFGDEEDGRSQLVTRDVAEVIDHMTVSILRTIVSGDRVVEFEPRTQEQAQFADDATEAVTTQFMRHQPGYRILHDWLKAGLLEKIGLVKTYAEPQPPRRVELEVPAEALSMIEAVEAEPMDEAETMWRVVVMEPQPPKFRDDAVPNEECLIASDTRDLEESAYVAHRTKKTLSELREMGFADEDLDGLEIGSGTDDLLSDARDGFFSAYGEDDRDGANRKVWLLEEYVRYDLNGDGVTELLCVHRVGSRVLSIDECDEQPFVAWCPFPMPHRLIGQSLADKVMDIQRTNSVLLRNGMDSLYHALRPRTTVSEDAMGENTIDDLLTVSPGAIIRHKGSLPPTPFTVPNTAGEAFQAIEFMIGQRESRTGITRLNQGLDADALNKTATGTAMMQAQGQQIEEYLARNFAEALSRLFAKKLRLMKRHGSPFNIRVDGEFREVNPAEWDEDMDVSIRVGLGSGRKEQRLQYRQVVAAMQSEAMAAGLDIVDDEKLYNTAKGMVADMGLGNVNDYFNDPSQNQEVDEQGNPVPKQPKPDPEMAKVEAEAQLKQQEMDAKREESVIAMQLRQAEGEAKIQLAREEATAKLQMEREKAQLEAQLARDKAQAEMTLAQQKMAFEQQMAERRAQMEERLAERNAARVDRESEAKMSKNREGGDLSK